MVVTLLIDANLDGHGNLLDARLKTEAWREVSTYLDIQILHFEQASLDRAAKDDVVWRLCQQHGYCLLTANRNLESEDSLEATIRQEGTLHSLPVFTFTDPDKVYQSTSYLDEAVERLLEYLLDLDLYRGAGRLYLP